MDTHFGCMAKDDNGQGRNSQRAKPVASVDKGVALRAEKGGKVYSSAPESSHLLPHRLGNCMDWWSTGVPYSTLRSARAGIK